MTPSKDLREAEAQERLQRALRQHRYDEAGRIEKWCIRNEHNVFLALYVLVMGAYCYVMSGGSL